MNPVLIVYLNSVEVTFKLPKIIGKHSILKPINEEPFHDRGEKSSETNIYILEIYDIEERLSLEYCFSVILGLRLASNCSITLKKYKFPNERYVSDNSHCEFIWNHYDQKLQLESLNWVHKNMDIINHYNSPSELFNRISNSLRLYRSALCIQNTDLALLGFMSSIESLFSIATQELTFRLSMVLAKFLGDNADTQRKYFDRIKQLYSIRSKLAHGDKVHKDEETAAIQLSEFWVPEAEEIARSCLFRIFDKKLTNYFDSNNGLDEFLYDILFESNVESFLLKNQPK